MDLAEIQAGGGGVLGALSRAGLSVLAVAYGAAVRARAVVYGLGLFGERRLPVRVVSVGNLVAGGTGKTPFVAWLASRLREAGKRPGILSRGYGSRPVGSPLSDEGTLLRDLLGPGVPQVEDPDRVRGGLRLLAEHPDTDVLVLDDGFQHRRLGRDLDLVLLDATDPFGLGRLLPRGRLREPRSALARAHAVVLTRSERVSPADLDALRAAVRALAPRALVAVARTVPRALVSVTGEERPLDVLRGATVLAYAGVGNPKAFLGTLLDLGARVVASRLVPDHHAPTSAEAARLADDARAAGASVVATTRKDLVKLRSLPGLAASHSSMFLAVDVETHVVEGGADLLARAIG